MNHHRIVLEVLEPLALAKKHSKVPGMLLRQLDAASLEEKVCTQLAERLRARMAEEGIAVRLTVEAVLKNRS